MKDLKFSAIINAPKQKVWETMLNRETYKEWTGAAWPGSDYEGTWVPNAQLRFAGPDGSGTLAELKDFEPYDKVTAEHVAILLPGGVQDRDSDMAKTWIGSIEQYIFTESGDNTELTVNMHIYDEWAAMFEKDWPTALAKLKEISER